MFILKAANKIHITIPCSLSDLPASSVNMGLIKTHKTFINYSDLLWGLSPYYFVPGSVPRESDIEV